MGKLSTRVEVGEWPPTGVAVPTVELRHSLPDGSHHIDWLIARDPARARPLITFRLPRPIREIPTGEGIIMKRIADHRAIYLEFEGEIEGGRGLVRRISRGTLKVLSTAGQELRLRIVWAEPVAATIFAIERMQPRRGSGSPSFESERWQLRVIPATMAGDQQISASSAE
jgi:hypothetical protein